MAYSRPQQQGQTLDPKKLIKRERQRQTHTKTASANFMYAWICPQNQMRFQSFPRLSLSRPAIISFARTGMKKCQKCQDDVSNELKCELPSRHGAFEHHKTKFVQIFTRNPLRGCVAFFQVVLVFNSYCSAESLSHVIMSIASRYRSFWRKLHK